MRRTSAILATLALASALTACDAGTNSNNSNSNNSNNTNAANVNRAATENGNAQGRDGLVDTNANLPKNANSRNVSEGTAVLTHDNGNKNTSGVKPINSNNGNHSGSNGNHNR